jgi:hypothetical protein
MVLACAAAAVAALRLDRHLPPGANQIAAAATPSATPAESQVPSQHPPARTAGQPDVPDQEPGRDRSPVPVTA